MSRGRRTRCLWSWKGFFSVRSPPPLFPSSPLLPGLARYYWLHNSCEVGVSLEFKRRNSTIQPIDTNLTIDVDDAQDSCPFICPVSPFPPKGFAGTGKTDPPYIFVEVVAQLLSDSRSSSSSRNRSNLSEAKFKQAATLGQPQNRNLCTISIGRYISSKSSRSRSSKSNIYWLSNATRRDNRAHRHFIEYSSLAGEKQKITLTL